VLAVDESGVILQEAWAGVYESHLVTNYVVIVLTPPEPKTVFL
jgi:hypothetical protein